MNEYSLLVAATRVSLRWNPQGLLSEIHLEPEKVEPPLPPPDPYPPNMPYWVGRLLEKLTLYFEAGEPLGELDWTLLDQGQWTDFQKSVYCAASAIPHGETRTYAWVAERMGKVFAYRAVGQALRNNPIPILIPCHRVISSQGGVGGFMGKSDPDRPELKLKQKLLKLENEYLNPVLPFLRVDTEVIAERRGLKANEFETQSA